MVVVVVVVCIVVPRLGRLSLPSNDKGKSLIIIVSMPETHTHARTHAWINKSIDSVFSEREERHTACIYTEEQST